MQNQVKIAETAGKTIEAVKQITPEPALAIKFTDGTFAVIELQSRFSWLDVEDMELDDTLLADCAPREKLYLMQTFLLPLELTTQEEIDAEQEMIRQTTERLQAERDRQDYERLKKKLEG